MFDCLCDFCCRPYAAVWRDKSTVRCATDSPGAAYTKGRSSRSLATGNSSTTWNAYFFLGPAPGLGGDFGDGFPGIGMFGGMAIRYPSRKTSL